MLKSRTLFAALSLCLLASTALPAQQLPQSRFERAMQHVTLGLGVPFEMTQTTSGTSPWSYVSQQQVSTAAGYLINARVTARPLIGLEANYKGSRFTQNYTYTPTLQTAHTLGVESNITEATFGYVAKLPIHSIIQPWIAAGAGSMRFKPTPNGGQGVHIQWRATYYWSLGGDYQLAHAPVFVRAQVRQLFYLAPDFGESYLTSYAHTSTLEPSLSFVFRF